MLRLNTVHCSQAPKKPRLSNMSVTRPASKTSTASCTPLHKPMARSCYSGPTRLYYIPSPVLSQTTLTNAAPDDLGSASVQQCDYVTRTPAEPTAAIQLAADARGFITTLSPEQHYKFRAAVADLAQKLAAAAAGTTPSPSSIGRAALADKPIPSKLGSAPTAQQIRQRLDDWADQYLTPDHAQPGSLEYNPKALSSSTLAKNLFKQLVLSLLPKADGAADAINAHDLGIDETLLATAAAAATAAAGASPSGAFAGSKPLGVTAVTPDGSKGPAAASATITDSFDPDVWEATAAAAAAALEDTSLPSESPTNCEHGTANATNASIAASPNMNTGSRGSRSTQKHAARADQALLNAAASGACTGSSSSSGSATHAARAEAALCKAAGDAVSAMPSGNHTAVVSSSSSHAQRATAALVTAVAALGNPSSGGDTHAALAERKLLAAALGSGASRQELLWAIRQLTAAAEHIEAAAAGGPGSSSSSSAGMVASRAVISQLLATDNWEAAAGQHDKLTASTAAAAALVAALPHVAATLPAELVVQVLVQCEDLVSPRMWQQGLAAAVAAAGQDMSDGGTVPRVPHNRGSDLAQQQQQQPQLLEMLITEVQLQLRVNARGPRLYAAVLRTAAAAAAGDSEQQMADAIKPLLCLMLNGSGSSCSDSSASKTNSFRGIPMSASAAAQLVLELAGSSSRADRMPPSPACTSVQLLLLSQVVPAMLKHYSSSTGSSSSSLSLFVQCLADQITEVTNSEQQMYLLLLLQPHITHNQLSEAVALTALAGSSDNSRGGALGGNTAAAAAAVAALVKLCNTSAVDKTLPLASYAELLSAALEVASGSSSGGVSFHEAGVGVDLARRQQQQQLLGAVVSVLGTFRGMRQMHAAKDSPAGQLLLPLSDLAAVLCYSQMLLPAATAARLAAAVAAALNPEQLEKLLLLLPQAAAAGFGKGAEFWRPLLHSMAVAAGLPDAAEEGLARKVATAAAAQGTVAPVRVQGVPGTGSVGAGQQQKRVHFADPAAVNAALRGTHTAATANKQPAAAVVSHPIQTTYATPAAAQHQ